MMRLLAGVLTLLAVPQALRAQDCQRLSEFDQLTRAVTEHFYDKTFRGIDWPGAIARHRSVVNCDRDERALATVVNGLLLELKASHTAVFTRQDLDYWAMQSIFSRDLDAYPIALSGIWPVKEGDAWYAKYVLPGTPAAAAGVSAGDKLIRLDGKQFDALSFSDARDSILVTSAGPDDERAVRMATAPQSVQRALLGASRLSQRVITTSGRKIGYFHLWAGTHPLFLDQLNAALADFEVQRIDALLLDLRGGYGGAGPEYLAGLKRNAYYDRIPKYALIDDGTRSGKELLAATLKHEKIATLVGSTTAGAFLGASPFRFAENQYLLLIAVAAYVPPGIGPIEGIGVAPDVAVAPCRRYCGGRDPQWEAAIRLIEDRAVAGSAAQ